MNVNKINDKNISNALHRQKKKNALGAKEWNKQNI